ncbi:MAG: hypothetical protein ACK8QZ_11425 [Anaerolineales bacterium]
MPDPLQLRLFRDWFIFYLAGRAVLDGQPVYTVPGFFNPIQVAWLLAPTTILPFSTWVIVMCAASFALVVILSRKKSHWTLLSLPFIFGMAMGTLDMFLWTPARLLGGWGLPLLTLKPQLAAFIIPLQMRAWWQERNWKEFKRFAAVTALLWGIPILLQPGWVAEWLHAAASSAPDRLHWAASIAGFSAVTGGDWFYFALFAIVLLLLLRRGRNEYYLAASFAPFIWPSDWLIATEFATWRVTILSWLLVPTGLSENGAQFYLFLGVVIWTEQNVKRLEEE